MLEPLAMFAELGLGPKCTSLLNQALDHCAMLPPRACSIQGSRGECQTWVTFVVI